jgi:hypothetical protein
VIEREDLKWSYRIGMDGSNNPPSRGGGRNRNRGKRNKRKPSGGGNTGNNNNHNNTHNNNSNSNANKKPSIPPPPQTKITLRNIQNFEKYGSVERVFQLVTNLLEQVNTAHNSAFGVELEMGSVRRLIEEEELVKKAQQEEAAKKELQLQQVWKEEEENEAAAIMDEAKDGQEGEETYVQTTGQNLEPAASPQVVLVKEPKEQELEVIVAPKKPSLVPVLTLRPLYVVPPRKTRRRGERGGCAYLVLTAPKIEPIEPPSVSVPEIIVEEEKGEEDKPAAEAEKPAEKAAAADAPAEDAPETAPEAALVTETPMDTTDTRSTAPATAPAPTPTPAPAVVLTVDYSGAVAKGRLLLVQAIEALEQQAQDDSKGPRNYAGCIVEPSVSGKTWRHQFGRVDRRENSIETTADYKNWMQSLTQQREDLKSRPKPAPGGGGLSTGGETTENGMPISAIVAHLRAKRQEAKRKKTGKKKKDKVADTKTKGGGGGGGKKKKDPKRANASGATTGGRGGAGGGAAAAGAAAKKKKKKTVKKKDKVGAAPTLLKPPAGG